MTNDIAIGYSIPSVKHDPTKSGYKLDYSKDPVFKEFYNLVISNQEKSFKVHFPPDFDMGGSYSMEFDDGRIETEPMIQAYEIMGVRRIYYHPLETLNLIIDKQNAYMAQFKDKPKAEDKEKFKELSKKIFDFFQDEDDK